MRTGRRTRTKKARVRIRQSKLPTLAKPARMGPASPTPKLRNKEFEFEICRADCRGRTPYKGELSCANQADRYEHSFYTCEVGKDAGVAGSALRAERSPPTDELVELSACDFALGDRAVECSNVQA
jgi:hypothetical protein